jgi:PAS domain S-box-containing protein
MIKPEHREFEMFLLFEMTPDLVCIADKDGFFKKINHAVIDTLEYSEEELFAQPISNFIHPEDKEITRRKREELLTGKALLNFENRYITKSGKAVWLYWTSIYLPEKELVFALAKNVTEKKEAEKEIEEKYVRLKTTAAHFKTSIEKDRKYFASELHEELAQLASAVKIDIDWLNDNIASLTPPLKSRMEHASAMSELLITTIRKISFSVSPNMLDHFGLNETIQWLCKEFTLMHGIPCYFENSFNEKELTQEIKLDIFRICQEALNNVLQHSNASKANINILKTGNGLCLSIVDNGKGYYVDSNKIKHGLTHIKERALSINAELLIESEIGKGTKILVNIPVKKKRNKIKT